MAKGDATAVARAVKLLQRWGGAPHARIEQLVLLRRLGKTSVEVAEMINASDSHIRNSLRAYDYMQQNKMWRGFVLQGHRANLSAVLERMGREAREAADALAAVKGTEPQGLQYEAREMRRALSNMGVSNVKIKVSHAEAPVSAKAKKAVAKTVIAGKVASKTASKTAKTASKTAGKRGSAA